METNNLTEKDTDHDNMPTGEEQPLVVTVPATTPITYTSSSLRWLCITLFCFMSASNAVQWISFSTVRSLAASKYDVNPSWIDLMSTMYMIVYIPFAGASSWLIKRFSFRTCIVISAFLNSLGSILRWIAGKPNIYAILLVGQMVSAVAQALFLALPAELSAMWFPSNERGLATAIVVSGNQFGVALGLLFSPLAITDNNSFDTYMAEVAIACSAIFLAIFLFLPSAPPTPPNAAFKYRTETPRAGDGEDGVLKQAVHLLSNNMRFNIFVAVFGVVLGAFYIWATFLQATLQDAHPDDVQIGWCGFIGTITSLLGSAVCPLIAGWTRQFKATNIAICFLTTVFSFTYWYVATTASASWLWIDLNAGILNFMYGGMISFGMEYGAELTYPVEESISSSILITFSEVVGIIAIESLSVSNASGSMMLWVLVGLGGMATVLSFLVPNKLGRLDFEERAPRKRIVSISDGTT
jgi:MFS family permease